MRRLIGAGRAGQKPLDPRQPAGMIGAQPATRPLTSSHPGHRMRRLMKFLHTTGAIGFAGGIAAYMIMVTYGPDISPTEDFARFRDALAVVSRWLIMPSMLLVLTSGLLAIAVHHPFQNAGWVWLKALTGLLVFEASLASIDGPAKRAAKAASDAVAGNIDAAQLAAGINDKWGALWVMLALSAANVVLAIWRPRFIRPTPSKTPA